jgi:hypothetical protein
MIELTRKNKIREMERIRKKWKDKFNAFDKQRDTFWKTYCTKTDIAWKKKQEAEVIHTLIDNEIKNMRKSLFTK